MRSRIIQKLDTGVGASVSSRSVVETFIAGATIVSGDWVMFDTSKTGTDRVLYVIQCTNVALGNGLVVGVALEAGVSGSPIKVCVGGYCAAANVDGAVVAGDPLVVDTTAGRAHVGVTGDITFCGVALEADTANVAAVWVYERL
jgi:hypothetical protein